MPDVEPSSDPASSRGGTEQVRKSTTLVLTRAEAVAALGTGIFSAFIYLTVFASFAFLLPVQFAFGRYGRRAGLVALSLAAVFICGAQVAALGFGGGISFSDIALGLLPPLVLLAAIGVMNLGFWEGRAAPYRAFAVAGALALLAAPLVVLIGRDAAFGDFLRQRIDEMLVGPLRKQVSQAGQSYEASALLASLDAQALAALALETLASSYAVMLLAILGGTWWIGCRMSGEGSPGRKMAGPMTAYRVPYVLVWPFLASWALVLATIFLKAPAAARAAAMNCGLVLAALYSIQGLGIVSHFLTRFNTPRPLRIAIAASAVLALVTSPLGLIVAIALPLVGVTEIWIPYRKPKGDGA
jgi:hypothetical protein